MGTITKSAQLYVLIEESSQPSEARRMTLHLAETLGLSEHERGRAAIVVTELATNLVKHAVQGSLFLRAIQLEHMTGIEILSVDHGPGIADLSRALSDGYSTAGSPGTGLGAVMRAASEFDAYSQVGRGTVVLARIGGSTCMPTDQRGSRAQAVVPSPAVRIGIVHKPKSGEEVCGDGWLVRPFANGWLCAVADGLGHGVVAKEAADEALEPLRHTPMDQTPTALLELTHDAAGRTRGAAVGIAVIDRAKDVVRFAGIGNIVGAVVESGQRRHLVSRDGIVGQRYRKAMEYTQPWAQTAALILHSDGLTSHWDLDQYPGLLARDPSLIAAVLYRDFRRDRDDATVLVVKQ